MNTLKYNRNDWREAWQAADDMAFDVIDSQERAGYLAGVLAVLCEDEANNNEGLLYAAITVAGDLAQEFDRDFLSRVVKSWDEEAENDLADRARGYILGRWPDFPVEDIDDLTRFGSKHTLQAHERVADDGASGYWFVFNLSELTGD